MVFPSLILNYAGQAALVLEGAPTDGNIFFRLCPAVLLLPLIVLATVATIIASQSIITGAFSMTRQAIQLGWLPRLGIKQTSSEGYGQIYVGVVNWLLMIVTVGLTIGFGKSDNLAAAYGIAVSLTMLMTSALLFIAMREIWGWSIWAAGAVAACFLVVDGAFFLANLTKIAEGGYVPADPGDLRLRRDVDLASRRRRRLGADARSADPGAGVHGRDRGKEDPRVPGHGGVPDPDRARYAAGDGLARQAQPRPARAPVRAARGNPPGALGRARATASPSRKSRRISGARKRASASWSGRIFRNCLPSASRWDARSTSTT